MQRIAAMFLPLIVKWVVGEHLLLKIENGVGEDERGLNRGSEQKPSTKGWRAAQDLITHFWRRWLREIVPKLNSRSKWTALNRNIAVNDIVLIVDPATRRGEWPLGHVHEVFPDFNGTVRSASVAIWSGKGTETKLWTRAAHQLCVLETEERDVSDIQNRAGCVADGNLTPQRP
jgi:hypothetical protein